AVRREQQGQDGPSIGLRDDGKRRLHGRYISDCLYSCQVILCRTKSASTLCGSVAYDKAASGSAVSAAERSESSAAAGWWRHFDSPGEKSAGFGGPATQVMSQALSTVMNSSAPSPVFVHASCAILPGT